MQNIIGLSTSMAYILAVLAVGTFIAKKTKGASETSRKFIHILVGNWVFITPIFTSLWAILLVPFSFIIINSLSLKYKLISAMERNDDSLGTVYYAISMFVLSGAAFLLGWKTLSFIGLLTMAYGDGMAAITGKKWGKSNQLSFVHGKSIVGTATVALASFIITLISILVLGPSQKPGTSTLIAIFISIITAAFSAFTELTGKKGCDNLSLPIGSGLFATLCLHFGSLGFYIYMLIALLILIVAYKKHSITMDGIVAAILTAATLYSFGGVWLGLSLLLFFVLGSMVSKLENENKKRAESLQEESGARNWKQVLANSLPACILVWLSYVLAGQDILKLLSFTVFCAAAADTFSSEIGMLSKGKVYDILSGKQMESGLSGGVSLLGIFAGIIGSILLSLLAFPQFGLFGMFFVAVLGFFGSILDSILGSAIQRKYANSNGLLQDKANFIGEKPLQGFSLISNNVVNFLSLSLVMIIGHVFVWFYY